MTTHAHNKGALYKLAFESFSDPVVIFDAGSRAILAANEAAHSRFARPDQEMLSLTYDELLNVSLGEDGRTVFLEASGRTFEAEVLVSIFCYEGRNTFCAIIREIRQ